MNDQETPSMTKFVVITTQRTGATFFIKCLDSHPQIFCQHQTIFGQTNKSPFKWLNLSLFVVDRPSSAYFKYRVGSFGRQMAHRFQRKKLIYEFLDDLYSRPYEARAVGFKVSYSQSEKYSAINDWYREQPDIKIIHFVRNNLLRRYLSHEIAKARGLYHATQAVAPVKIHVSPQKLKQELTIRTQLVEKYRALFKDKCYLEVSYEAFVADRNGETEKILQFLNIDQFVSLETDTVKINPNAFEDMIANYDEVKQALTGTEFERYLTA